MKDFIQKNADEVAIVIYDAPLPPKYFRLTKRFIKTLFVVVPFLLLSSYLVLFIWGLGIRLKETPAPKIPDVISEADQKINILETEVRDLRLTNQALTTKIAQGAGVTSGDDPHLMVIKKPYGMQNLLAQNQVTLDQFEFVQDQNKVTLKFQIISATPENRVSGHVMVFMLSETGLMAWPEVANKALSEGVKYSMGDTFAVSRLRPTNADFNTRVTGENVKFVIYIFNREGDLLLIRETETFNTGKKS